MKKNVLLVLPLLLILSSCNSSTPTDPGSNPPSTEENILHGEGVPSDSLGKDYSHYLDESSGYVYEKNNGKWYNRFTYGSNSLYENSYSDVHMSLKAETYDKQEIKDALMNSFYTTNGTCLLNPVFADPEQTGYGIFMKFNCDYSMVRDDTEEAKDFYSKVDSNGVLWTYDDESQSYIENTQGSPMYCATPHPTIENIYYTNYLIYDDELGGLTSIICGNLSQADYDEENNKYIINNIEISHSAITSHYFSTPIADNLELSFEFSLSKDGTYMEDCFFKIVTSEAFPSYNGFGFTAHFSDLHQTEVILPVEK